jgi:hypothetical protein
VLAVIFVAHPAKVLVFYLAATLEDADATTENKFYTINTGNIVDNPTSLTNG